MSITLKKRPNLTNQYKIKFRQQNYNFSIYQMLCYLNQMSYKKWFSLSIIIYKKFIFNQRLAFYFYLMNDIATLLLQRIRNIIQLINVLKQNSNNNKKNVKTIHIQNQIFVNAQSERHLNHYLNQSIHTNKQQTNVKKILQNLTTIKKSQKLRNYRQDELLNSLNGFFFSTQHQVQQFYQISIQIFQSFDRQFSKYKNKLWMNSVSMGQNLKRVYSFYFLKHNKNQQYGKVIPQALKNQIWNLSPSFFLGWIRKWEKNVLQQLINQVETKYIKQIKLLSSKIKQQGKNEQSKSDNIKRSFNYSQFTKNQHQNSYNFIQKHKSFKQQLTPLPHANPSDHEKQPTHHPKPTNYQKVISNHLSTIPSNLPILSILNSKQVVYGYCLDQLKNYYKNIAIQELDIDFNYLRGLKKLGKKEEILMGQNSRKMVETLVESKNSEIKNSIKSFQAQYSTFIAQNSKNFQQSAATKPQQILTFSDNNISISNLKVPYFNSKLLSPNIQSPLKNKIKYKYEYNNTQNITEQNQNWHVSSGVINTETVDNKSRQKVQESRTTNQHNRRKYASINEVNIFKNIMEFQSDQIQNKIKILKRINNKSETLSGLKINKKLQGCRKQQNVPSMNYKQKQNCYFLDKHIQQKQKSVRFPKLAFRDFQPQNNQHQEQTQIFKNFHKRLRSKEKKRSFIYYDNRLNKSQLQQCKNRLQKQQQKGNLRLSNDLSSCSKNRIKFGYENPQSRQNLYKKRFFSQAVQRQDESGQRVIQSTQEQKYRPFKCNKLSENKKVTINAIKFNKNKIQHQDSSIQSSINQATKRLQISQASQQLQTNQEIVHINQKIKNKQTLKNIIDKGLFFCDSKNNNTRQSKRQNKQVHKTSNKIKFLNKQFVKQTSGQSIDQHDHHNRQLSYNQQGGYYNKQQNVFKVQRFQIQKQNTNDEFINYLKRIQKQKQQLQTQKSIYLAQKQKQIKSQTIKSKNN